MDEISELLVKKKKEFDENHVIVALILRIMGKIYTKYYIYKYFFNALIFGKNKLDLFKNQ